VYRLATKRTTKKQVEENASVSFTTTRMHMYWFLAIVYCWPAVS